MKELLELAKDKGFVSVEDLELHYLVLIQKWLREKQYDVVIGSTYIGYNVVIWDRKKLLTLKVEPSNLFETYEEALKEGLIFTLKLLKLC